MTPLRRKMREDMQIRNLATSTQKGYLWRVGQFARHFRRSPDQLGPKEIHQYQVHLVQSGVHYGSLQEVVRMARCLMWGMAFKNRMISSCVGMSGSRRSAFGYGIFSMTHLLPRVTP